MNNMLVTGGNVKKICPYMEKCYRKNPIHFSEMSHPHLEKLVKDQLDGTITIPDNLDFECVDRSQLQDQLSVLQMVLRRQRDKAGNGFIAILSQSQKCSIKPPQSYEEKPKKQILENPQRKPEQIKQEKPKEQISSSLLEKVERNKQAALARREARLRELDAKAEILSSLPSTSSNCGDSLSTGMYKLKEELEKIKKLEDDETKSNSHGSKRVSENSLNYSSPLKRSKLSDKEHVNATSNISSERTRDNKADNKNPHSQGSSIIEDYTICDSSNSRDSVRKKAIAQMKRQGYEVSVVEPGEFGLKYALSAPYHMFLTRVVRSKPTYEQKFSVTFPEILDKSLGEIVSSLQINFMVDVGWLCLQYLLAGQKVDMLIVCGERVDQETLPSKIKLITVKPPTAFGCHHSKIMILKYKDNGIRVVVSTANLYSDDWENRTQGVWISPHLPEMKQSSDTASGESPTGFKKDLEEYLLKYKEPALTDWICAIRRANFSSVNVFFIASVPGSHKDKERNSWGHKKLSSILSQHATLPPDGPNWPIIAQSSSIGSLGPKFSSWLQQEIVPAMSQEKNLQLKSPPKFHFVYPTINNYKQSFDMRNGSCCLPYSIKTHQKQLWLKSYLYQWKGNKTSRDKAMPHIKSYTRVSPDFKKIPWFVLTSANLSKAAWGTQRASHFIMNYEAGVIFLPKFVTGETTFPIAEESSDGAPVFHFPYDLPLVRYEDADEPFVTEFFSMA
ncbi:probable tyrosyl-DNA phosphodiesterase [Orussus abietinus]|uniref:probable tyrosyl-DNA phosphodiesterase n=1 Tax=Orussus abietinus TaxID=222816 RepID=UPI000625C3F1|nr:probable tyrosyl-DNA phosphodiesterase [Orussus abietinus]